LFEQVGLYFLASGSAFLFLPGRSPEAVFGVYRSIQMILVLGVVVIVLVVIAIKNRPEKKLGFPASRKMQGKHKRRKERNV
jgi:hypothetical protein